MAFKCEISFFYHIDCPLSGESLLQSYIGSSCGIAASSSSTMLPSA